MCKLYNLFKVCSISLSGKSSRLYCFQKDIGVPILWPGWLSEDLYIIVDVLIDNL